MPGFEQLMLLLMGFSMLVGQSFATAAVLGLARANE